MLRAVKFHCELCVRAIKIQNVFTNDMLASELEPGKTPSAQFTPKLFFLVRLVAAELAGDVVEAHKIRMLG